MLNAIPVIKTVLDIRFLFGIVNLWYFVEDRCPDLTAEEAQKELGYKYKHQIRLYVFGKQKLSWVYKTLYYDDEQPFQN